MSGRVAGSFLPIHSSLTSPRPRCFSPLILLRYNAVCYHVLRSTKNWKVLVCGVCVRARVIFSLQSPHYKPFRYLRGILHQNCLYLAHRSTAAARYEYSDMLYLGMPSSWWPYRLASNGGPEKTAQKRCAVPMYEV